MLESLETKLIAAGVLLLLLIIGIITFGAHERTVGRDKYKKEIEKTQIKYTADTKKVTTEVVTKYVDRIKVVKENGDTIIKKVPVYVNVKDDSKCTVNNGFVRLWDSANQMSVPGASSSTDGSPSTVVLSDIAAQHSKEATICTRTESQVNGLQNWIKEQQSLSR